MNELLTFFSHPATVALIAIFGTYFTTKAVNRAAAGKTTVEGIVISIDKSLELSNTIMVLHQSNIKVENEKAKLERKLDNCLEDCTEIKICVKEFFASTATILKDVNDSIILRQVETLKQKLSS